MNNFFITQISFSLHHTCVYLLFLVPMRSCVSDLRPFQRGKMASCFFFSSITLNAFSRGVCSTLCLLCVYVLKLFMERSIVRHDEFLNSPWKPIYQRDPYFYTRKWLKPSNIKCVHIFQVQLTPPCRTIRTVPR